MTKDSIEGVLILTAGALLATALVVLLVPSLAFLDMPLTLALLVVVGVVDILVSF